ncbi:hypothetical protein EUGRSUZ_H03695 [Eucalyptus grandis]|uniref:Uncharacterized protein n=2 Tax=Eucalyptus grandis TaxID=71139 RepID=A0ACC3JU21_EUCGR|nr:hypothetical protein EUGRSUZ_H03695 [Eucalyptus grandis]
MSWMGWNRTSESFHLALVYGTAEDPGHAGVEDPTRASVSSTASSGSGSGSSLGSMSARHFLLTVVSLSLFCLISPPGENAKSRGLSIEKKIEFLESLTGGGIPGLQTSMLTVVKMLMSLAEVNDSEISTPCHFQN